MRNSKIGFSGWLVLVGILVGILAVVGYFKNIYELTQCDWEAPYKCEAIHAVGVIPVVGVFTGYMSEDE